MDISKIYQEKFGQYPEGDVRKLGWGSVNGQMLRFRILSEIGFSDGDSVLDVGCGYGDIVNFFTDNKLIINYTGIDISKEKIELARKKYPDRKFEELPLSDINDTYDWVIGSGIFCFSYDKWKEDTIRLLQKMYDLSKRGISVNFLSNLSPFKRDAQMMYVNPDEILSIVKNISNKFTLRHDYRPNDFSLYLYK